jgi:hypothetical protein
VRRGGRPRGRRARRARTSAAGRGPATTVRGRLTSRESPRRSLARPVGAGDGRASSDGLRGTYPVRASRWGGMADPARGTRVLDGRADGVLHAEQRLAVSLSYPQIHILPHPVQRAGFRETTGTVGIEQRRDRTGDVPGHLRVLQRLRCCLVAQGAHPLRFVACRSPRSRRAVNVQSTSAIRLSPTSSRTGGRRRRPRVAGQTVLLGFAGHGPLDRAGL